MTLAQLVKSNRYPIVFVGSGLSKRYLTGSPSWDELLGQLWVEAEIEENYFSFIDNHNRDSDGNSFNDNFFTARTAAGNQLEKVFHERFFNDQLKINGLTKRQALFENKSP